MTHPPPLAPLLFDDEDRHGAEAARHSVVTPPMSHHPPKTRSGARETTTSTPCTAYKRCSASLPLSRRTGSCPTCRAPNPSRSSPTPPNYSAKPSDRSACGYNSVPRNEPRNLFDFPNIINALARIGSGSSALVRRLRLVGRQQSACPIRTSCHSIGGDAFAPLLSTHEVPPFRQPTRAPRLRLRLSHHCGLRLELLWPDNMGVSHYPTRRPRFDGPPASI